VGFSIVIPTHNRASILAKTLAALKCQRGGFDYEVIVVDDGSTDATESAVAAMTENYPASLLYLRQENRKQGAARNRGVREARGRFLLFLGDDTVPAGDFIQQHLRSHRNGAEEEGRVVIGYTTWPAEYRPTRFMRYVGEQGWQFGFSLIQDPENLPFNFFYTSNLSMSRRFFEKSGGFDEDFREYGWEDIELSVRLKRLGMRLVYNPKAMAYHFHPTTLASFIQRQRRVGHSAWGFYTKHPELRDFLNVLRVPNYSRRAHAKLLLLTLACRWLERSPWPDLTRYYPDVMSYYYNLGILQARKERAS
jgi:GT2 family glycosyltransferase